MVVVLLKVPAISAYVNSPLFVAAKEEVEDILVMSNSKARVVRRSFESYLQVESVSGLKARETGAKGNSTSRELRWLGGQTRDISGGAAVTFTSSEMWHTSFEQLGKLELECVYNMDGVFRIFVAPTTTFRADQEEKERIEEMTGLRH